MVQLKSSLRANFDSLSQVLIVSVSSLAFLAFALSGQVHLLSDINDLSAQEFFILTKK